MYVGGGDWGKINEGRKNAISQHLLPIYFNIKKTPMVYREIWAAGI